ncbi:hypothetical protein PUNSTDRAFT_43300 [Punctularia strigosozonata HHB-11173 SS5]|uniref:uncharacterized protein n=1 Tax=Punctularia strigosozonata (strain HHB-11173) TaxID=741275 RepID=UPI0004416EBA|nr:uncharacterized protein PUNSTDRAFT_43300 [Punctularia strigosozonata HHB-11173 SS5]EIN10359.1 hypothetical protein PUNSTDRAFT_43300 [Punctularia strigosozonata HHB-11173 SS5]
MADEEDDYLSDKFLVEAPAPATKTTKTYSQRRRDAEKEGQIKMLANRMKSRRERELESREEGLSKSLFDRAEEEKASGIQGGSNKALAMMMKMGFKPGEALGKKEELPQASTSETSSDPASGTATPEERKSRATHRIEPLPVNEWTGRKGIGLGKRTLSPTSAESLAKKSKLSEDIGKVDSFRDRARREHEERRAEGILTQAQRTCCSLDEKAGMNFNVFWLNANDPDTVPAPLTEALKMHDPPILVVPRRAVDDTYEFRLRRQMQADALQPLDKDADTDLPAKENAEEEFSTEAVEQAAQFLQLPAKDKLGMVLDYLRRKYSYCYWCGTQYVDTNDMEQNCPGPTEDDHD